MSIRRKVVFIHFQPLELYPPVMNMIDFIGKDKKINLFVITNRKSKANSLSEYIAPDGVKIYRPSEQKNSSFRRYFNYIKFYLVSLKLVFQLKPSAVLYFETLSSWPALLYKKLKNKDIKLMVHYHEYSGPREYAQNMLLSKWMHRIEMKMYHRFSWISQTNTARMSMFKEDNHLVDESQSIFHIMPNYPSRSWLNKERNAMSNQRIKKMVFVGSLGFENMYLKEVIEWLQIHDDEFCLDIYSYNIDKTAKKFLDKCGLKNIQYCGGCDYQSLPEVLEKYDIGLDIYKPYALNHVYGVSNKVFEYLACGLDVWFSQDMIFTRNYIRNDGYPKILAVNFQQLSTFDFTKAIERENLPYLPANFFYEDVYPEILEHLLN